MKIENFADSNAFLRTVQDCKGDVILKSRFGDVYNLKSTLTKYLMISKMMKDEIGDLELFCSDRADEEKFFKLINEQKLKL